MSYVYLSSGYRGKKTLVLNKKTHNDNTWRQRTMIPANPPLTMQFSLAFTSVLSFRVHALDDEKKQTNTTTGQTSSTSHARHCAVTNQNIPAIKIRTTTGHASCSIPLRLVGAEEVIKSTSTKYWKEKEAQEQRSETKTK